MKRVVVYLAGPYTSGNQYYNVTSHIYTGVKLIEAGFAPIMPLLSHYVEADYPVGYDIWMDVDLAILEKCDALFRLDTYSPSKGADREEAHAKELHIPVFYTFVELRLWRDIRLYGDNNSGLTIS